MKTGTFICLLLAGQSWGFSEKRPSIDWKKISDAEWKQRLPENAYPICRRGQTERPFSGRWHNNRRDGIYLCSSCARPLFSSKKKVRTDTGWPTFAEPIEKEALELREDRNLNWILGVRTAVHCERCGAHLGHLYPGVGLSINSACLHFQSR